MEDSASTLKLIPRISDYLGLNAAYFEWADSYDSKVRTESLPSSSYPDSSLP